MLTYLDVLDTAIKIGLGALISASSGYFVLCKTNSHAVDKEKRERFYDQQEERKEIYVDFLAQSHKLVYEYITFSCTSDTPEYFTYLKAYNHIQVISDDTIRVSAKELFDAVNKFILLNKSTPDKSGYQEIRNDVDLKIAKFQYVAKQASGKLYTAT